MSKKFLVPIRLVSLQNDPSNVSGTLYYNVNSNKLRYANGTNWLNIASESYVDDAIGNIPSPYITSVGNNLSVSNLGQLNINDNVSFASFSITNADSEITSSANVFGAVSNGLSYPAFLDNLIFTSSAEAAEYLVSITKGSSKRLSKITVLFDGSSNPTWSEYGIVEIGSEINTIFNFVKSGSSYLFTAACDGAFDLKGTVTLIA